MCSAGKLVVTLLLSFSLEEENNVIFCQQVHSPLIHMSVTSTPIWIEKLTGSNFPLVPLDHVVPATILPQSCESKGGNFPHNENFSDKKKFPLAEFRKQSEVQGCCYRVKVGFTKGHKNGAHLLHPYIFNYYYMEPGLINGRNHYTTKDGRFAISYCGDSWWIQSEDNRGKCQGWAHSGWQTNDCAHDIDYTWRFYIPSIRSFIDAKKGLSIWCKS